MQMRRNLNKNIGIFALRRTKRHQRSSPHYITEKIYSTQWITTYNRIRAATAAAYSWHIRITIHSFTVHLLLITVITNWMSPTIHQIFISIKHAHFATAHKHYSFAYWKFRLHRLFKINYHGKCAHAAWIDPFWFQSTKHTHTFAHTLVNTNATDRVWVTKQP